ncbi:hypothetical protein [Pseudoduganella umbonata]|uniref:Uncharacterized protein n=1 Tax=Pseudoduganella umbonata TaxID=864828 RepID=A0A4P8HR56_9BURK|nr:hypothetical protein [Pseudoduganella umbonata]MBB3222720.1 hypothetical protein [Pseudoduganella umbonata]QCP10785.1 hypothetical protein FCL38_10335 [Pseudoduganella umbonata]
MIPLVALPVAPHTMLALLQFIEQSDSALAPGELADKAILAWLESRRAEAGRPAVPVLRGYQWKCLFLPEGTRLRVWCRSEHGYAEVVGDRLMHNGLPVSPNQFVAACSDTVRNAWVEINVLMPGEKAWKLASMRRREIEAAARLAGDRNNQPVIPPPPLPFPPPAATPQDCASEPEDDGFGNPPLIRHGRLASHALSSAFTEGRRTNTVDRRHPNAPLDRRDCY